MDQYPDIFRKCHCGFCDGMPSGKKMRKEGFKGASTGDLRLFDCIYGIYRISAGTWTVSDTAGGRNEVVRPKINANTEKVLVFLNDICYDEESKKKGAVCVR